MTACTAMARPKAVSQRVEPESHTSRKAPVTQKRPRWKTKPSAMPSASPVRIMVFSWRV